MAFFPAFIMATGISSLLEILLIMYFGILTSKGYVTPAVAFAFSLSLIHILNTVQSPAASTGASFQAAMRNGKFHGTIWPTTPIGSCSTSDIMLPGSRSASPVSASSTPAK